MNNNLRALNYDERDFVMAVMAISGMGIDIFENDDRTWFKIGYGIANAFGRDGREHFHSISSQSTYYSKTATDAKYDRCLQSLGKYNINLGFFFYKTSQAFFRETGMSLRGFLSYVHSDRK